jgi:hypothetical protein
MYLIPLLIFNYKFLMITYHLYTSVHIMIYLFPTLLSLFFDFMLFNVALPTFEYKSWSIIPSLYCHYDLIFLPKFDFLQQVINNLIFKFLVPKSHFVI